LLWYLLIPETLDLIAGGFLRSQPFEIGEVLRRMRTLLLAPALTASVVLAASAAVTGAYLIVNCVGFADARREDIGVCV
jgi:hypothetical protein